MTGHQRQQKSDEDKLMNYAGNTIKKVNSSIKPNCGMIKVWPKLKEKLHHHHVYSL